MSLIQTDVKKTKNIKDTRRRKMQGLIATVTYETKHPSEENLSEVWGAEILNYRV